jgi:hypothetical protein
MTRRRSYPEDNWPIPLPRPAIEAVSLHPADEVRHKIVTEVTQSSFN